MTIEQIYQGAGVLITKLLREELTAQGHQSTGQLSESIESRVSKTKLEGFAISYAEIVNEGLDPQVISFSQLPHLIAYFKLKGFDEANAKKAAVNTIKKWMREGLPTQASKRFSTTGNRKHFVESTFFKPEIDAYMVSSFDAGIEEQYRKTPSETI